MITADEVARQCLKNAEAHHKMLQDAIKTADLHFYIVMGTVIVVSAAWFVIGLWHLMT